MDSQARPESQRFEGFFSPVGPAAGEQSPVPSVRLAPSVLDGLPSSASIPLAPAAASAAAPSLAPALPQLAPPTVLPQLAPPMVLPDPVAPLIREEPAAEAQPREEQPLPGSPSRDESPQVPAQPAGESGAGSRLGASEDTDAFGGVELTSLLLRVVESGASDLHLTAGARPCMRVNGHIRAMDDQPILTPSVVQALLYNVLSQRQREKFEENLELDFAYSLPGRARFRVNIYRQRDALGAAMRLIPYEIKPLESLGVPASVSNFAMLPRGFVLVTGPTGSGKSTTLASVVDLVNRQRHDHIMTVEDPIEFLHEHQGCLINQREVGEDTWSFANALKHVLRQDPDVIMVGEMRDLETISVALTAAETGHLVFGTLHTQDAAQTVDRVIDVFPPHQQQQIRVQLASSIQGVVCQTLCRTVDGKGRVVAAEVMVVTPAIRNLIREGKTHQISSALQAGGKFGMVTMDQSLADLVKRNKITYETGLEKSHSVEEFNRLCGRA